LNTIMGRDIRRFHDSQWEDSLTYGDGAATSGTAFHRDSTTGVTAVDEEETYTEGFGAPLPPSFGQVRAQFNLTQSRSLHSTPSRTETTPDSSSILSEGSRSRFCRTSNMLNLGVPGTPDNSTRYSAAGTATATPSVLYTHARRPERTPALDELCKMKNN
jgi:hypothetical protein